MYLGGVFLADDLTLSGHGVQYEEFVDFPRFPRVCGGLWLGLCWDRRFREGRFQYSAGCGSFPRGCLTLQ